MAEIAQSLIPESPRGDWARVAKVGTGGETNQKTPHEAHYARKGIVTEYSRDITEDSGQLETATSGPPSKGPWGSNR